MWQINFPFSYLGASINQQPDLFKAALLGVPFVDVVPTMIDATVPLTVVEWEEWGTSLHSISSLLIFFFNCYLFSFLFQYYFLTLFSH